MVRKLVMAVVAGAMVAGAGEVCFARLGETEAELEARFGKPLKVELKPKDARGDSPAAPAEKKLHFKKLHINVIAYILRGRAVRVDYVFTDGKGKEVPVKDNVVEAEVLLQANGQGSEWQAKQVPPLFEGNIDLLWQRSDGKAAANVFRARPSALRVIDNSFIDEANNNSTQESLGLGGF